MRAWKTAKRSVGRERLRAAHPVRSVCLRQPPQTTGGNTTSRSPDRGKLPGAVEGDPGVGGQERPRRFFLAAWTHLDSVIDGETIAGWLATTTRRRSIDHLRAPASARRSELDEQLPALEKDDPEAAGRCAALAADARRVLERMPALQRRCWELRQLHELSYDEIALDLDITPTAVRGLLSRARLLMASELAHRR
nr:RNA polymerase sigma factor [Rathayibacter sp. VKM Ac-2857]